MTLQEQFALKANNKNKRGASYTALNLNTPRDSQQNKMGSDALGVEKYKISEWLLNITSELKIQK